MKRLLSFVVILALVCTLCPVLQLSSVMTASAANLTYFYGFEDGTLPSNFNLTYCSNASYTNGIFSFVPAGKTNADPMITITQPFKGDEVNQIRIRMKHDLVERSDGLEPFVQVYYNSTDSSGNNYSYNEGRTAKTYIEYTSDDYATYVLDLREASHWSDCTINNIRIDPVNTFAAEGTTVDIDYIMLCKYTDDLDPIISFDFETDGDYEDIITYRGNDKVKTGFSVANGCLNLNWTTSETVDNRLQLPAFEISTSQYEYAEIIMKHDISVSGHNSDTIRMYMKGTFGDGSELKYNESYAIKPTIAQTSNGEFKRYVLPFTRTSNGTSLDGATITSIRIDPTNNPGTYSVDSIRFVPYYVQYEPLDSDNMTLSYTFENNDAGCAKGTMKIDFGGQNPLFAKNVELMWASGNATDGYTALGDYSIITSKEGDDMAEGYVISRPMYIPETATALIARVTDVEKNFDLAFDIPADKIVEKTEPKFVAALTSDFHFGDSSVAKVTPAQKYYDLQAHVEANADTLLVAGDIVQWYGVKSMDEYYYREYLASGGTKYTEYADYDPTAENNQWEMAMEYFQSWKIPVYIAEGNHDTPSTSQQNKGHIGTYFKDWMTDWINFGVNSGMYDNPIEREKYIYDNTYEYATYYDDYVTGADGTDYHVIMMRNFHMGRTKLTEQELDWLDKKLYENEATGTPTFVIIHEPLQGTVIPDGTKHSADFADKDFRAVVDKHPNAVVVTGHTHYSLYSDWQWTINGEGKAPSWINDGAVVDTALYDPETNTNTSGNKSNCELVYAEIYEDRIVTRAYDVVKQKYIATSVNQITLKDETTIGDISVSKTASGGYVTLTAKCDTSDVTYQWYVDGEAAEAGASVTVPENCTDYVAVRVTNSNGSFRSQSFDCIYDADITYDEGRTYFVSMKDADSGKFSVSSGPNVVEWIDGVGGQSDEMYHISGTNTDTGTIRIYSQFPTWTKKNENSNYLVISYNAMPLNTDTYTVYLCTKSAHNLSIRSPKLTPFKWNNVKVVVDLTGSRAYTYVNGVLLGNVSASTFISSGQIRLSPASVNDNTYVPTLAAYVDDMEIYETVNAPVIMPVADMSRPEVNGTAIYASENKIAYVPAGTKAGDMSSAFKCVVVSSDGTTKAATDVVSDTDLLMYYDHISDSYIYYTIAVYTDYSSIFVSGVDGNSIKSDTVKFYVNAVTAGDTAVVAQYDSNGDFLTADYAVCTAGLNEVLFTSNTKAKSVSVLLWSDMENIVPLTKNVELVK